MQRFRFAFVIAAVVLAMTAAYAQSERPTPSPPPGNARGALLPTDIVTPAGLPAIGKWMIDRAGGIAHWLGEIVNGKKLREPVNIIVVDAAAASVEDAKRRLVAAARAAGYPIRFGHSTGYRGFVGDQLYPQLPAGRDDAFSNDVFEISNNHGRIFGPYAAGGAYFFVGAFSREEVRPWDRPGHRYASFNRARDDFSLRLDQLTAFKRRTFIGLDNAIIDDPHVTTGDHDGLAVLLRADR